MAAGDYIREIGHARGSFTATSVLVISVTASATAGNAIIGRVAAEGGVSPSSVSDTKGNTWFVDVAATSGPKASIIRTMQDVGALAIGDTVTVNFPSSITQKAGILDEFTGLSASPLDKTASGSGATTARTGGTTAATTQADELVIGCFAIGAIETSFTPGAGYSNFTTPSLDASGTSVEGEYRVVASTGTQNPTATGGFSGTSRGCVATYKLTTSPNVTMTAPTATASAAGASPAPVLTLPVSVAAAVGAAAQPTQQILVVIPLAAATAAALIPTLGLGGLIVTVPSPAAATAKAMYGFGEGGFGEGGFGLDAPAPIITIAPGVVTATATALVPSIGGNLVVVVTVATATAQALTPVVGSGPTIFAVVATATASAPSPTPAATATATTATAAASAPAPTFALTITAGSAVATAAALPPLVPGTSGPAFVPQIIIF